MHASQFLEGKSSVKKAFMVQEQVMQVTCSVCFMQFMVRIKLKVQDEKSGQCATHSVCITVGRGKVSVTLGELPL